MHTSHHHPQLISFLQDELAMSTDEVAMAMRHHKLNGGPIAMILWHYGLVSLEQLSMIFDWQAARL